MLVKPIDLVTNHPSLLAGTRVSEDRTGWINAQTLFSRCICSSTITPVTPSLFAFSSFYFLSLFSPSLVTRFFAAEALNRLTIKTAPVASFRQTAIFRCRKVEKEFMATAGQPGHCELKHAPVNGRVEEARRRCFLVSHKKKKNVRSNRPRALSEWFLNWIMFFRQAVQHPLCLCLVFGAASFFLCSFHQIREKGYRKTPKKRGGRTRWQVRTEEWNNSSGGFLRRSKKQRPVFH